MIGNDILFNKDKVITEEINKNKNTEIRFDIDSLKDSKFKSILKYYDSISGSPTEFLFTGLLACLSGAVGKHVYFQLTNTIKIYLNVWAVIIGRSTIMRKTSALNTVKEDLQRIDIRNYNHFQKENSEYLKMIDSIKDNQQKKEIDKPVRKYILFPQDSTIESLSDILSYSSRGLLLHSEFGAFLQQLNRGYSADAKQFLTNIFDIPESYEVSRVTKNNTMLIRPYLSILGASTIDWIQEHSSHSDLRSGFFARFIYAIRNKPDKEYRAILELSKLTKQSEDYTYTRDIYEYLTELGTEIEMKITNKAAEIHIRYDKESFLELLQSENDNELSFKARLIVYSLKFAGLIALTEKRTTVTENDMLDAITITEYFKRNVEHLLNNELTKDEFARSELRILDIIEKKGGKAIRSDLMNLSRLKARELDEVIQNLVQKEKIEITREKHQYNKRTVQFYSLKSN